MREVVPLGIQLEQFRTRTAALRAMLKAAGVPGRREVYCSREPLCFRRQWRAPERDATRTIACPPPQAMATPLGNGPCSARRGCLAIERRASWVPSSLDHVSPKPVRLPRSGTRGTKVVRSSPLALLGTPFQCDQQEREDHYRGLALRFKIDACGRQYRDLRAQARGQYRPGKPHDGCAVGTRSRDCLAHRCHYLCSPSPAGGGRLGAALPLASSDFAPYSRRGGPPTPRTPTLIGTASVRTCVGYAGMSGRHAAQSSEPTQVRGMRAGSRHVQEHRTVSSRRMVSSRGSWRPAGGSARVARM